MLQYSHAYWRATGTCINLSRERKPRCVVYHDANTWSIQTPLSCCFQASVLRREAEAAVEEAGQKAAEAEEAAAHVSEETAHLLASQTAGDELACSKASQALKRCGETVFPLRAPFFCAGGGHGIFTNVLRGDKGKKSGGAEGGKSSAQVPTPMSNIQEYACSPRGQTVTTNPSEACPK